MTSLVPRPAYSQEELDKLYPQDLELRLVQVLLRHGERAPVSARFQNVRRIYHTRVIKYQPAHRSPSRQVSPPIGRTAMLRNAFDRWP